MATLTPTTSANIIPALWAKEAQFARDKNFVAARLVDHQFENQIMDFGDTVKVTLFQNMTADVITPGTALVAVAPTETQVNLVINKFKGKAVTINDQVKAQSAYDLATSYGNVIGRALTKAIDTDVLTELFTGSTLTPIDGVAAITYANIVAAVVALDAADVPVEDRAAIFSAAAMGDLRTLAEFTRYDAAGQANPSVSTTPQGALVGHIYGIPVYMTNNVPVVAGTPNKTQNVIFQKNAVALAVQAPIKMESQRQALAVATDMVGSCLYGVKTIRGDHTQILKRN